MGLIKKILGFFGKHKAAETARQSASNVEAESNLDITKGEIDMDINDETTNNQTDVKLQEQVGQIKESVVDGDIFVEDGFLPKQSDKTKAATQKGVGNYINFDAGINSKYFDKRKRLIDKRDNLTEKICKIEDSIAGTDDSYLVGLAKKDLSSKIDQRDSVVELLDVEREDFAEVMQHKSNIAYLNLIQRKAAELKKAEKEAMANCSQAAIKLAKGCHPILPFDTDATVKSLESKVATVDEETVDDTTL